MLDTTLSHLAQLTEGQLIGEDALFSSVSTDTRHIEKGALFVALVGERFDAHHFGQQALQAGASALLVERALDLPVAQVVVQDTKLALGQLAADVHQRSQTATVAITGSCGKTTVKEMTASILQQKGKVLFTAGNFNNDIGVPLTLLRSQEDDDYAVIELGANHIGEIAYTTRLVKPQIALVNNVAAAHLEGFGSIDGVKQAKGEIYQGLAAGDVAVVNLESNGGEAWQSVLADKKVVTFSAHDPNADFYASDVHLNEEGQARFVLHTPKQALPISLGIIGQHNVSNAIAASIIALHFGASEQEIQAGLRNLMPVKGRVDVQRLTDKIKLIDDSYNASVPAMKAAVDLLASFSGTRWLILGYMAELGDESLALHRQVGEHAAPFGFEHVLTFGEDTRIISDLCQGLHFADHSAMIDYIKQHLASDTESSHTLLVKGANSAGMSNVVAALKENFK
ncbi:UDP-N-acetylmuramoyl-tripeptide--D-alanyl-D-alanine ligase [Vibrio navarrensis]|uniref:UDP-N-acetylmuramoyl-tripeptide--D-alanyl-D- alanine ligase n=1 Tax=Vibrio navarrensis TaxID=29495 RepID=UPI00186AB769|nr:UDP-N-acetylmuramoyl-tripeptide--D-alanyl-D-alanine ligase [Vibrio navarrensis]MBE4592645.1 UDP-N-acetylmuramoyl-tripeptide--D-alanyl-D-alanine ligase [Vibrio navarrensis]